MHEELELEILKNITNTTNQKSMAEKIGYSVGKINYILKGLISKGLIKSERFLNSNNKIQYKYLLTENGIKEKIDITEKFIKRKKEECDQLQSEMESYKTQYSYAKNKEETIERMREQSEQITKYKIAIAGTGYVYDIVDGIIKVIDNPANSSKDFDAQNPNPSISSAPYRVYNIGNNAPVQLLDFIKTLEDKIGIEAKKNFMDIQPGDVVSTYADTNDLIKDFDYKPDTNLADGIREFVEWYKKFYK